MPDQERIDLPEQNPAPEEPLTPSAEQPPVRSRAAQESGSAPAPRPRRKRRARSVGVTFLVAVLYVVCVLSIAFLLATVGWRWAGDLLALNKEPITASVTIQAGESVEEVAERLHDAGLVEYPFLFQIFAGFTNKADLISSGTYELNTNMDYSALLANISAASRARETVTVTIPEGYTVKEIFQLLESQGACSVEALEYSALHDEFDYSFFDGLER
ncbi:MAG: endolytic transglycosylase MltG, partial [Oscillospiraceae bacterium]|nr:endolytic transglycosylase MltG [Oscillospiraceae bacterium]